jgi:hypothetical protein
MPAAFATPNHDNFLFLFQPLFGMIIWETKNTKEGGCFMKQDPIIFGGMAGVAGTIAKEAADFLSVAVGFSQETYWHVAASIFVLPKDTMKPGGWFLGAVADMVTGAFLGILLLYLIKFSGKNYLYLKGLGFSWLIWLVLFGLVVNLHIVRISPTDIGTSLSAFIEHSVFGLTAAWFIGKYALKTI